MLPEDRRSAMRVHGNGDVPVLEVAGFLASLDEAYSGIVLFDHIFARAEYWRHEYPFPPRYFPSFWLSAGVVPTKGRRALSISDISSGYLSQYVSVRDRLELKSVRLESPGFWDFVGKLNVLEVIRQYLNDRHERRKDAQYRGAAENDRLWLENELLRNRIIHERVEIARSMGATDQDLAPALNNLLMRPLQTLDRYQDRQVISTVDEESPKNDA